MKRPLNPVRLSGQTLTPCNEITAYVYPVEDRRLTWGIVENAPGIEVDYEKSDCAPISPVSAYQSCRIRISDPKKAKSGTYTIRSSCRPSACTGEEPIDCSDLCPAYSEKTFEVVVGGDEHAPPKPPAGCPRAAGGSCQGPGDPGSAVPAVESMRFDMFLGDTSRGQSAGRLFIKENAPRAHLVSAASIHIAESDQVTVRNVDSDTRQVKAPACLAVIVDDDPSDGFEVRFYDNVQAGSPDQQTGLYSPGTPFRKWTFEAPGGGVVMRVKRYAGTGGDPEAIYDYEYSTTPVGWRLKEKDGAGAVVRTTWLADDGTLNRTETYEITDAGDVTAYKQETLHTEGRVSERRVYTAASTYLSTLYTYGPYGRVQSIRMPDGSWIYYEYYASGIAEGMTYREYHSWGDVALTGNPPTAPNPAAVRVIEYSYAPVDTTNDTGTRYASRPRTVTESIEGHVVSKTYYAYYPDSIYEVEVEERDAAPTAEGNRYGAADNLRTTTFRYRFTCASSSLSPESEQVYMIEHPDGRVDVYDYAKGTYTLGGGNSTPGKFDANSGPDMQITVTHAVKAGSSWTFVEGKSTKERIVTDSAGNTLLEETAFISNPGWDAPENGVTWTWTAYAYDARGRREHTFRDNGTQEDATWTPCCGLNDETDVTGVVTTYVERFPLGWVKTKRREALPAVSVDTIDHPAVPALTTGYTYDAMGRVLTETATGGTSSLDSETHYDWAGRVTYREDTNGLETSYLYETTAEGGRKVTVTRPGGATETTQYFRDGRVRSVTGSGVVARYYAYGVNADGMQWTRVRTGQDTTNAPYVKTTTDHLGRTKTEEKPGYGGTTVTTSYEYWADNDTIAGIARHAKGQLMRTTTTAGAAQVTVPTLFEYDPMGNVYRTGMDLPPVATPNPALDTGETSTDRITETETWYDGVEWPTYWQVTASRVYVDGSATPVTRSVRKRRLTNLIAAGVAEQSVSLDVHNNATTTSVTVNRAAGQQYVKQTVDAPDSDTDARTITRAGLVQSSMSQTGLLTTYAYDALGRRTGVTDPRTNTTTTAYDADHSDGWIDTVTDADGNKTCYEYDTASGRLKSVTLPAKPDCGTKKQYFAYDGLGRQTRTWGDTAYPVEYVYDDYGRRTEMYTWQDRGGQYNWTGTTWPAPPEHTGGDQTTWTYDTPTGLLTAKTDADGKSVTYTYTPDGKLATRTWARSSGGSRVTTYDYFDDAGEPLTGELQSMMYSDGTPTVRYGNAEAPFDAYDRLGRRKKITDAVGTRTFGNNDGMQLDTETIDGSAGGLYSKTITRAYQGNGTGEVPGRDAGFSIGGDYAVTYHYDAKGRFEWIEGPGLPAYGVAYERLADSDAVEYVRCMSGSDPQTDTLAQMHRMYESDRDLLAYVENKAGSGLPLVSKYAYVNDPAGRRTSVVATGTAFAGGTGEHHWDYAYNDRSELTGGNRRQGVAPGAGSDITPNGDYDYTYDNIGNRKDFRLDSDPRTYYCVNNLNQYTFTDDAAGTCPAPPGPVWSFSYDVDGNMTGWNDPPYDYEYSWDGENRLVEVYAMNGQSGTCADDRLLRFAYDYMGRRVRKQVFRYIWNGETQSCEPEPELVEDWRFVYDGWNVVLVLDGRDGEDPGTEPDNVTVRKYTWGLDMSGLSGTQGTAGIHGAGGIGGLLACEEPQAVGDPKRYWFFYDANGNVGQVLRYVAGSPPAITRVAHYEYDPYGQALTVNNNVYATDGTLLTGTGYANDNPFRFSTKWLDTETGLAYYGYRYYSPRLGRWLSRDPIGERGGQNLQAFVRNDPVNKVDPAGKWSYGRFPPIHRDPPPLEDPFVWFPVTGCCEPLRDGCQAGDRRVLETTTMDVGPNALRFVKSDIEWKSCWKSSFIGREDTTTYKCKCTCEGCGTVTRQPQKCNNNRRWEDDMGPPAITHGMIRTTFYGDWAKVETEFLEYWDYDKNTGKSDNGLVACVEAMDAIAKGLQATAKYRGWQKECEAVCKKACPGPGTCQTCRGGKP